MIFDIAEAAPPFRVPVDSRSGRRGRAERSRRHPLRASPPANAKTPRGNGVFSRYGWWMCIQRC